MVALTQAPASSLNAHHLHLGVRDEIIEQPDRVASAAHAGEKVIRQASGGFQNLPARFLADHAMEFAHHHRIRMRPQHGAEQVMGMFDVRDPVAHGLVDGVLERPAAGVDRHHF